MFHAAVYPVPEEPTDDSVMENPLLLHEIQYCFCVYIFVTLFQCPHGYGILLSLRSI